ncbi:MAG: TonB-dependent receptor, partial [Pseudomonadota bacterium]
MRCFYKSIATVAVLTVAAPVTANSTNSEGAEDTIVVTATLRPEAFQNVPASFVVLSGDRFAGANAFDGAEEVTQLLSGVQAAVANGTQVAFQIRGVGAVDHQALTPTAAAVYMDGVYLATNVQTGLFLYDVERAEILKGPQGTLYGRNASGGAIHFISARPSEDQTSYLSASYGRFDRIDVKGAVGERLSDTVSVRLAGRYFSQDPVLDNVQADPAFPRGPEDAGGVRDEFGVRGSLLWSAGEATDVLFRVHYEEDNGVNPAPRNLSLDVDDHDISVGGDGVQDTDNEFFGASVEATSQWRGWDVFSLTAVEGYNQQYGFDFDGSQAPFGDPTLNANLRYDRDFLQASQEVRLRKSWDRVDVLIGLMGAIEDFEQEYLIWCGELDPATLIGDCGYVGAPGRVGGGGAAPPAHPPPQTAKQKHPPPPP